MDNFIDARHENHKVLWETKYLPFDNVPFIVVNHRVYECQHGVDRHLSAKRKTSTVRQYFVNLGVIKKHSHE